MNALFAPVRLQRSRRKGFDLQALSLATNGLACVIVDRSTPFGNHAAIRAGLPTGQAAVDAFRRWVETEASPAWTGRLPVELGGRNLACWCELCPDHRRGKPLGVQCDACAPCHADVEIELANAETARAA